MDSTQHFRYGSNNNLELTGKHKWTRNMVVFDSKNSDDIVIHKNSDTVI